MLNSPAGKKLDRIAKGILLRKVLLGTVLPAITGLEINEIVTEILSHVNDSNNELS